MKTAILQIFRKINNSLPSRHSTKDLLPCHNCGKQPKRGYSHSGAWIGCSCGQLIYVGFGNDLDLAAAWDRMNDIQETEPDDCLDCEGTGIGKTGDPNSSRCTTCKGRGYFEGKQ